MARGAVVSTEELISPKWKETITSVEKQLEDSIDIELIANIDKTFNDFVESENTTFKIGPIIQEHVKNNEFKEALGILFQATYVTQELAAFFRVKQYPVILGMYNQAKSIVNMLYAEWKTDTEINTLCGSNVATQNHADNAFLKINLTYDEIRSSYERIRSYLAFVEEQQYAINRLDSALRLQIDMEQNQFRNSAAVGNV